MSEARKIDRSLRNKMFPLLISLLLGLLASCATQKRELLESSVDLYIKALRRGDHDIALGMVSPEKREAFSQTSSKLDGVMISNVELKQIRPDNQLKVAGVSFWVEYFSKEGTQLRSERRELAWIYQSEAQTWFLNETNPFGRSEK